MGDFVGYALIGLILLAVVLYIVKWWNESDTYQRVTCLWYSYFSNNYHAISLKSIFVVLR